MVTKHFFHSYECLVMTLSHKVMVAKIFFSLGDIVMVAKHFCHSYECLVMTRSYEVTVFAWYSNAHVLNLLV